MFLYSTGFVDNLADVELGDSWKHDVTRPKDHQLLDLVKRSIESTTPVHILPPRPHFLHVDGAFLVAFNLFPLR